MTNDSPAKLNRISRRKRGELVRRRIRRMDRNGEGVFIVISRCNCLQVAGTENHPHEAPVSVGTLTAADLGLP